MDPRPTQTRPGTVTRPVPIGELLHAWLAVQRGDFHHGDPTTDARPDPTRPRPVWRAAPGEVPVLVVGCTGSAGASTVALLLATTVPGSRVVDCAPAPSSGLAGAATAELGEDRDGWLTGRRDTLTIQRRHDQPDGPGKVPAPLPWRPGGVSVIDTWWEPRQLLTGDGWLPDLARTCPRVLLVTRGTIPGMARLETSLALFGVERCWAVATALPRRWPTPVARSLGARTLQLSRSGRLLALPANPVLAVTGVTTQRLPRTFDRTARRLAKGLLT